MFLFFIIIIFLLILDIFPNFFFRSGAKKKHRKETIALKRRDRMLNRGVDLEKINLVKYLEMKTPI